MSYEYQVIFLTGVQQIYFVPADGHSSLWDQVDQSLVKSFTYIGESAVTGTTVTPIPPTPVTVNPPTTSGSLLDLPGEIVQWFQNLWNALLQWFEGIAASVYNCLSPLFDAILGWIQGVIEPIITGVGSLLNQVWAWIQGIIEPIIVGVGQLFNQVWSWIENSAASILSGVSVLLAQVYDWIQTANTAMTTAVSGWFKSLSATMTQFAADVGNKVAAINDWFSNEFIDPFIDWLTQFPGKMMDAISAWFGKVWQSLTNYYNTANTWFYNTWQSHVPSWLQLTNNPWSIFRIFGVELVFAIVTFISATADIWLPMVGEMFGAIGTWLLGVLNPILTWLTGFLGDIGTWIGLYFEQFIGWLGGLVSLGAAWFASNMVTLLGSGTVLSLEATGKLEVIIDKFVSPAIVGVFNQFESLGPVTPISGAGMGQSIGKLASFTIAGLASMTIAGELLAPLKQIGLGNISAIIYDLINYRALTAAFMSVLAMVYITQPLKYYYNRAARPMIPDERSLAIMTEERVITPAQYADNMAWHGYPDSWISQMQRVIYRPVTPYMLELLAEAGLLNDDMLEHALDQAGYDDVLQAAIKQMMSNKSQASLAALSTTTAMELYQEGFNDETDLRTNLSALGVADVMLDRYVLAANLKFSYNYNADLKSYYIDAYHRRDIEAPELMSDLATLGISPTNISLIVQAQAIKRLAKAAVPTDPAIAIQLETIREQRTKSLITEDQETAAIVALSYDTSYAQAISAQDTVKLEKANTVTATGTPLPYQSDEGKIEVDTIRRQTRARQMSATDESNALAALQMPAALITAVVANDQSRLVKVAAA